MMRIFQTSLLIAAVGLLSGCAEYHAKFDEYMSTMPQSYTGSNKALLKPPPANAGLLTAAEVAAPAPMAQPVTHVDAVPLETVAMQPQPVATPPGDLSPMQEPVVTQVRHGTSSAIPQNWVSSSSTTTSYYESSAPVGLSPVYTPSPMPQLQVDERIVLTPPGVTRAVDYGDSITIYPLDSADAQMPYIPPARATMYSNKYNKRKSSGFVPPGLNP